MYTIKEKIEDFYVREIIELQFKDRGKYFYYLLKKRNMNTLDAIRVLKRRFNLKEIGYCGNKDKNAVTEQYISINKKIKDFKEKNLSLEFVGRGNKRLNLGDNKGNYFKIIVRNFDGRIQESDFIENYFDEQRFSKRNHLIGKNLIKKNFAEVCSLLNLEALNNDYVNSIKRLEKKGLLIYIHAYQAYLFNEFLSRYLEKLKDKFYVKYSLGKFVFLKKKIKNLEIPLLSFDTELKDKNIKRIYSRMLKEENLKLEDFLIKQFPELVNETVYRKAFTDIHNLKIKKLKDKVELEFELDKGSYATVVVKKLLS